MKKNIIFILINDNCHALGSRLNKSNKYAIKHADIVTQSFHPVKHFTTGEGGAVLTSNKKFRDRIKFIKKSWNRKKCSNRKKDGELVLQYKEYWI